MGTIDYGLFTFPIDRSLSGITAQIASCDESVKWDIDVFAERADPGPEGYDGHLAPHLGIQFAADTSSGLSSLDGREFHVGLRADEWGNVPGHCYTGEHLDTINHVIRILKADFEQATIDWEFHATETPPSDLLRVSVRGVLPFREVSVWFENVAPDLEQARKIVARHFYLPSLAEPVVDRWMVRFAKGPS